MKDYNQQECIKYFIENSSNKDIEREEKNIFSLVENNYCYTFIINQKDVTLIIDSTYLDVEERYISFSDAIGMIC